MPNILVIEDDRDIANLLKLNLRDANYEVSVAHEGRTGLQQASSQRYQLIILDLTLPLMDGLALCKTLRGNADFTPVLMLTAKSSEFDRVLGLELGADDYLTKPFSMRELLARVKALLRRVELLQRPVANNAKAEIRSHGLVIDIQKRKVTLDQQVVNLTGKEFDLLLRFAQHPGHVYTRSTLLSLVWGYGYDGYEHTVNSHINRLRAKIETDPAQPRYIQTVWGVGYKFCEDEDHADTG